MKSFHTIYIVGAGAIGKALAVFLKAEGKHVIIIRGSTDDHEDHVEEIKVQLFSGETISAAVRVTTLRNLDSPADGIIVMTNKSFGNTHLAEKLKLKTVDQPVIILQNGLGVEAPFIVSGFKQIYRCVLFATSQTLGAKEIRFKPVAASPIGIVIGEEIVLSSIVAELNTKYFEFRAEADIQPVIWTKTIVNCVFNSICPLMETDNGVFHRNKEVQEIASRLIKECLVIARAEGIRLSFKQVLSTLLNISKLSDGQLISTYQDILNNRPTEIETMNFAIVKIADRLNKGRSVSNIRLLGELIRYRSEAHIKTA